MRSIALVLLALLAAPAALRAQPGAPDADEYAVWSAVLDSLAPGADHVRLLDSAFVISSMRKSDEQILRGATDPPLDSAAVGDYLRRNGSGVRLESRFSGRRPVVLVRTPGDDWSTLVKDPHVILVARPGFDLARTRAVVTTITSCASTWCGRGYMFELARDPGGGWRVVRMRETWIS